ncbi:MAG: NAD-dependent epimerase/dehydratase family protein [Conexivisphaerales archaeon]|nr:NAD-dependent epimerase/dehydratase family protein [Conexivisphaerales archaeon]
MLKILVTGGAGFIGSHLVDALMERGHRVVVVDDLSSGSMENLGRWRGHPNFKFVRADLSEGVPDVGRVDAIYHLAADPEVRTSSIEPGRHYRRNVLATFNLLEFARKSGVDALAFASTSTVYGEPGLIPTPEDYGPLIPISIYGATKLAAEAMVSAYAQSYGFRAVIFRLANIVGPRSRHGVIYDFVGKLRANPRELEVLGDGTQSKSYLYVEDCVDAMLLGIEKSSERVSIYNVGSEDRISVIRIAEVVSEEMELGDVSIRIVGGPDGRGWTGDVKVMQLEISRIKGLGWRPRMGSEGAVRRTVRELLGEAE